jgi:hypothetical protein
LEVQVDPVKPFGRHQFYEGISIQIGASWPRLTSQIFPAPSFFFALCCTLDFALFFHPPKGRHLCIAITSKLPIPSPQLSLKTSVLPEKVGGVNVIEFKHHIKSNNG